MIYNRQIANRIVHYYYFTRDVNDNYRVNDCRRREFVLRKERKGIGEERKEEKKKNVKIRFIFRNFARKVGDYNKRANMTGSSGIVVKDAKGVKKERNKERKGGREEGR